MTIAEQFERWWKSFVSTFTPDTKLTGKQKAKAAYLAGVQANEAEIADLRKELARIKEVEFPRRVEKVTADLRKRLEETEREKATGVRLWRKERERAETAEKERDEATQELNRMVEAKPWLKDANEKITELASKLSRYESGVEVEGIYYDGEILPEQRLNMNDGQRVIVNVREVGDE